MMNTAPVDMPAEEMKRRADEIYARSIAPTYEPAHNGEYVMIDVLSGEFEVDSNEMQAMDRLLARRPQALIWARRVHDPYIRHFGGRRRTLSP